MVDIISTFVPVGLLFAAVIFFTGLAFQIATQRMRRKKRARQTLVQRFSLSMILLILVYPLAVGISTSDGLVANLAVRCMPILLVVVLALYAWRVFMAAIRFYPKDEPKPAPAGEQKEEAVDPG